MDFVMADIHGAYRAFKQVMERSGFDPQRDRLFQLGDIVDKGYESYEVVEALLQIPNIISVRGNHDQYFMDLMIGIEPAYIHKKDMLPTIQSYEKHVGKITFWDQDLRYKVPKHYEFFRNQVPYYVDNNRLFIHAGVDRDFSIDQQSPGMLQIDREFWLEAVKLDLDEIIFTKDDFAEIYVGHSPTTVWQDRTENCDIMIRSGVVNLNTCVGYYGRLSMMNLDTKEVFYSDTIKELYK